MLGNFIAHHKKELIGFGIGIVLAVLFLSVPALHRNLDWIDGLGYPGMFIAGIMYGSGLTASLATVIFIDSPRELNLIIVGLLAGLGSALYDLTVYFITRRGAEHGWIAAAFARLRERRHIPNWPIALLGAFILMSPLPDELAAGLFGVNRSRALPFFLLSFASNTLGVLLLSGVFRS